MRRQSVINNLSAAPISHNTANEILQRFQDTHESLGLPEGDYLQFANDMGRMHTQNTMTAHNVMDSLRRIIPNPNTEKQAKFITECEQIMGVRHR